MPNRCVVAILESMIRFTYLSLPVVLLGFFISAPVDLSAQAIGLSQEQVQLDIRPAITQPNQPVEISLTSNHTDLHRARVSLYQDGVLVEQGIGQTRFVVTAPPVGKRMELELVTETINRGIVRTPVTLAPAQVDLLYEAVNSHVPVLYQGKKLPAHEGGVRVVAMPYLVDELGRTLDPESLIYSWYIDEIPREDLSGFGQRSIVFAGSAYYRTESVAVEVRSVDGALVAQRTIEIPAFDPVVRFYEEHPLWGTDLSKALVAEEPLLLGVPEMTVRSVPYFVSDSQSVGLVDYQWQMNGQTMTTFGDRNIINLRAPESGEGQAQIDLEVTHTDKLLQIARSVFTVVFGETAVQRAREAQSGQGVTDFFGVGN